ncbi:MAG: SUMF1/EgtB/PvdO family nonheme iron enzyme [Planctomycetaceae bacterium]|nr:SUMF1/EgtB/PvdO family nonheme iron enzyme [Planctomycetaceae bacterium]
MGLVYKVVQENLNKIFAMKLLSAARVNEPRMQLRFRREMRAAGKIDHPNVVRASDADEVDGVYFLVMEFVDGVDLSALRKHHKRFSVGHACEMIRKAAVGLEEIHRAGMVHRDMKPGNLMLSRDGQIKILDLGLALLNPQYAMVATNLTSADQLVGTIDYMSPEQAGTTHRVDHRADIFGLGATLFTLLTGRTPLPGGNANLIQKLSALAIETAPSVQSFRDDVPDELAAIVARMLQKNPEQRYQNALEVVNALQPFCDGTGLADLVPEVPVYRILDSVSEWNSEHDTVLMSGRAALRNGLQIDAEQNQTFLKRRTLESESSFETKSTGAESVVQISESGRAAAFEHETSSSSARMPFFRPLFFPAVIATIAGAVWSYQYSKKNTGAESPSVPQEKTITATATPVDESTNASFIDAPTPITSVPPLDLVVDGLKSIAAAPQRDITAVETTLPWNMFSATVAPDQRTAAIHQAIQFVPASHMVQRLLTEPSPSIRAGLLLALSEFPQSDVLAAVGGVPNSTDFVDTLLQWYVKDPDSEVHACAEFLLRCWGQQQRIDQLRTLIEQKPIPVEGGWYQPSHVSAMVVIPGPLTASIGSPADEPNRFMTPEQNEDQHSVTVPYTFAIGLTEITRHQYWRLRNRYWEDPPPDNPDVPINQIRWEHAAAFCNRLSLQDCLEEKDLCYITVKNSNGTHWRQKPDALNLSGYRLPTDDEWEIACRAGTRTSRSFGNDPAWIDRYAVCNNSEANLLSVASRKPNSLGLFDMLGNVSEWIHTDMENAEDEKGLRRIRGGSAWTSLSDVRSAARYVYPSRERSPKIGFRVARTIILDSDQHAEPGHILSAVEFEVGPPACTPQTQPFADSRFIPLRHQEVVRFGTWDARDSPVRSFRLTNTSDQPLRMTELPSLNGVFEYETEPPLEIAPHETAEFRIQIPVHRVGELTCDLNFRFDGENVSKLLSIRLHGCIEGPLLEVFNVGRFGTSGKSTNMGSVPMGSKAGTRLFLRNIGDQPVEASVTSVSGPFTMVDPLEGTLVPHQMDKSFRLILDTSKPGPAEGTIKLNSEQDPPTEFSFSVRANVSELKSFSPIGVFRNGTWLIDHNRDTVIDETIEFGTTGDSPLTGDWNGDGICDIAVWHKTDDGRVQIQLRLRGDPAAIPLAKTDMFLESGECIPVAADLDGDGRSEIGYVIDQVPGRSLIWVFDAEHDETFSNRFVFGPIGSDPVIGDWDGDGVDEVAVSFHGDPAPRGSRLWYTKEPGTPELRERAYLSPHDFPVAGDWDGDGDDDFGGWRPMPNSPSFWQFETSGDSHSNCDLEGFGKEGDLPFVLRCRVRHLHQK